MMRFFCMLMFFGVAAAAGAVEVTLREQAAPHGSIVRLGDVAAVTAEDVALAEHLATTPLMPAPAEGSQLHLRTAELRDLLASRGVDVRQLKFTGAELVSIASACPAHSEANDSVAEGVPAAPAHATVVGATEEDLTAAITHHLQRTTGHPLWKVKVDADPEVLAAFAAGGAEAISGGTVPWTGRQRFVITAGQGAKGVLAYARVDRQERVAMLVRGVERGDLIRRSDVALQAYTGALPQQTITDVDALIGREAVAAIRAGALVMSSQVRAPLMVRRGDRVTVRARAGGITVRTFGVAQQDGSLGELVMVQAGDSKERFAAQVSGLRELEVLAGGASATEVAAAPASQLR